MMKGVEEKKSWTLTRAGRRAQQAMIMALLVALALPATASSDRAVKSRVSPVYPELARRMKITGVVKVEATVDVDGKVKEVKTLSGNHALQQAAEDAVRKWKFVPAAAGSTEDVDVNFAMTE
jgi:TonB family protein